MSKFLTLVLRESVDISFFVPKKACASNSPSFSWDSAISGAANVLGALIHNDSVVGSNNMNWQVAQLNAAMQDQTNKSNQKIAAAANKANREQLEYQNAFNLDMWNKQNAYNDPKAQVDRLKVAGINPAFAMGNGSAGQASSIQSAQGSPAEKSYNVAPRLDYRHQPLDYSGFGQAVNAYYQNQVLAQQAKNIGAGTENMVIQNEKDRKAMSDILRYLHNQAEKEGAEGQRAKRELAFFNAAYDARLQLLYGDTRLQKTNLDMMAEQMEGIKLDNAFKKVQNAFQTQLNDKQLAQMDATLDQIHAQIGLISANKLLTDEQRLHEIEKKVSQTIDNGLKGIDFKIKKQTKSYVIDQIKAESEMSRYNRSMQAPRDIYKMLVGWIPMAKGL